VGFERRGYAAIARARITEYAPLFAEPDAPPPAASIDPAGSPAESPPTLFDTEHMKP
jgi:hypothetical protein